MKNIIEPRNEYRELLWLENFTMSVALDISTNLCETQFDVSPSWVVKLGLKEIYYVFYFTIFLFDQRDGIMEMLQVC